MSAHVLLNLSNELRKRDKMRGLPSILSLFRNEFNKFNVRFYLSNGIKITLKSHFCRKNVIILSFCTQRCYGRHNVCRKSVNYKWCMDFIVWRFFTPRRDVIMINRGSYISAHVLLNLMTELGESDFFATSLVNLIIQQYECCILFII